MEPGNLRHPITIQQKSTAQDSYGATVESWSEVAQVWAAIEPLRGMEAFAASQLRATVNLKVTIRYREDVTPQMRILWDSKILEIVSVIDVGSLATEMQLLCAEAQP